MDWTAYLFRHCFQAAEERTHLIEVCRIDTYSFEGGL